MCSINHGTNACPIEMCFPIFNSGASFSVLNKPRTSMTPIPVAPLACESYAGDYSSEIFKAYKQCVNDHCMVSISNDHLMHMASTFEDANNIDAHNMGWVPILQKCKQLCITELEIIYRLIRVLK